MYLGSVSGLSATPNWTAESSQAYAYFGFCVGTAGDVNGDGYADVIVGAEWYDNGQTDEGAAFVYRGSASGLPTPTMHVASIEPLYADQGGIFRVGTKVTIQDEASLPTTEARVLLQVEHPDGYTIIYPVKTGRLGRATLSFYSTLTGTYTFTVLNVTKAGVE